MIEPELQHYLANINQNLQEIKNKKLPGLWRSFFNGMFSAFGYVVGLAVAVVLLIWILEATGLLPKFQKQVADFQLMFEQARNLMNNQNQPQQGSGASGSYQVTLPDGQKLNVNK